MFDFDNDGDVDIHITNGHVIDDVKLYQPHLTYAQKDLLYENLGGRFRDISDRAGVALQAERVGRGLAVADFDNDRNLDVAISSIDRRPALLRNQGSARGNWPMIQAQGSKGTSYGFGTTIKVQAASKTQVGEISTVASYLSSNDVRLHFGVGAAKTAEQLEILWTSGAKQVLKEAPVNQIVRITEL